MLDGNNNDQLTPNAAAGLIYSDKLDNLTISKDILFDNNNHTQIDKIELQNIAPFRNDDSSKHLALKELLRNR